METVILTVLQTLTGAIVVMYITAIPIALKMASFSKKVPGSPTSQLPWFERFLLAWLLFPFYIIHKAFK